MLSWNVKNYIFLFYWKNKSLEENNLSQPHVPWIWEGSLDSEEVYFSENWLRGTAISFRSPGAAKVLSLSEPWYRMGGGIVRECFILFHFLFHLVNKEKLLFSTLMRFGLSMEEVNVSRSCVRCTQSTAVSKSMFPRREHLEDRNAIS